MEPRKRGPLIGLLLICSLLLGQDHNVPFVPRGGALCGWSWTSTPGTPTATLDTNSRFAGESDCWTGLDHEPGAADCTTVGWQSEAAGNPECNSTAGGGMDGAEWVVLDVAGGGDRLDCRFDSSCLDGNYTTGDFCLRWHQEFTGSNNGLEEQVQIRSDGANEAALNVCLSGGCNGDVELVISGADGSCNASAVDVGNDPALELWMKICFFDMDTSTIDVQLWAVATEADLGGSPTTSCSTASDLIPDIDGWLFRGESNGALHYVDNVTPWDGDPDD